MFTSILRPVLIVGFVLGGCGEKEEEKTATDATCSADSALSLINGIDTSEHPEIGITTGDFSIFCSGTFVSDTTMITAAHCVPDSADFAIYYVPGATPTWNDGNVPKVRATKVIHLGYSANHYFSNDPGIDQLQLKINDIAVLVFPPNTAPASVRVADVRPEVGSRVMLLGYGGQEFGDVDPTTYPPRRAYGYNKIVAANYDPDWFPQEQLYIGEVNAQQSTDANGEATLIQKGDSGGALIYDGKLVGVTSRNIISGSGYHWSAYTSTAGDEANALFAAARLQGADIPVGDAPVVVSPAQPGSDGSSVVVAPSGEGSGSTTPINSGSTLPVSTALVDQGCILV